MKRMVEGLLVIMMAFLSCNICFALPVKYTVSGNVYVYSSSSGDDDSTVSNYSVSGEMFIDSIVLHNIIEESGNYNDITFDYQITQFNINMGQYSFWGSGNIHSYWYSSPEYQVINEFEQALFIGNGDWALWSSCTSAPEFYNSDGVLFNDLGYPSDYFHLPYKISIQDWRPNHDSGPSLLFNSIEVTQHVAPVPEPTSLLLFGTGLVFLAGSRKKFT